MKNWYKNGHNPLYQDGFYDYAPGQHRQLWN